MKLTALQIDTLALIRDGKVEQRNHGHGAWRIHGANPSVVGRLVSLGLARWTKWVGGAAELTEAGRSAIASTSTTSDQRAFQHGMVVAASVVMKVFDREEIARAILGAAGVSTVSEIMACGADDYDADLLRSCVKDATSSKGYAAGE